MSPQRPYSYPYPGDEFTRIDMTLDEARAIRAGNDDRERAWNERIEKAAQEAQELRDQAAMQSAERAKKFAEEQRNRPEVAGARFPIDRELLNQNVRGARQIVNPLGALDPGEFEPVPWYGVVGPLAGPLKIEPTGAPNPASIENFPRVGREKAVVAELPPRAGGFSGGYSASASRTLLAGLAQSQDDLRRGQEAQTAAGREQTQVALESSAAFTEAAYGVDAFGISAETSTVPVRHLTEGAAGLGEQFGGFNALVEATPGHIAEVNAAFDATAQDQLPELIGQMGTLEYQTLAAVDAFNLLAGAPRGSPPAAGTSGDGGSAGSSYVPDPEFLNTPEPANLQEIYLDQFNQGHDMSGFHSAEHWWGKHLEHVAQLKAAGHAYAQGTSFAPGGMALVGEMGPELVNLPRGSQVIPNPRLGSEVTVNVNVEGSVVAERDLAQRIRQELIRTSRRTVDLGFVA